MRNGQTSIEYLLLTAGVILTAVVAGQYVVTSGANVQHTTETVANAFVAPQDTIPPNTIIQCDGTSCFTKYNHDVTISFVCQDNLQGTGCKETKYRIDGGQWKSCAQPDACSDVILLGNGKHQVSFYSVDIQGNQEKEKTITIDINSLFSGKCTINAPDSVKEGETVHVTVTADTPIYDANVEIVGASNEEKTCGDLGRGDTCTVATITVTKTTTITAYATDQYGNRGICGYKKIVINHPPTVSASCSPSCKAPQVYVNASCSDPDGDSCTVYYCRYKLASGDCNVNNCTTFTKWLRTQHLHDENATYCYYFYAEDSYGARSGTIGKEVTAYLTNPYVWISCNATGGGETGFCCSGSSVTVSVSGYDADGGSVTTYYCSEKDGENKCDDTSKFQPYTTALQFTQDGNYVVYAYGVDNEGVQSSIAHKYVRVTTTPTPTCVCHRYENSGPMIHVDLYPNEKGVTSESTKCYCSNEYCDREYTYAKCNDKNIENYYGVCENGSCTPKLDSTEACPGGCQEVQGSYIGGHLHPVSGSDAICKQRTDTKIQAFTCGSDNVEGKCCCYVPQHTYDLNGVHKIYGVRAVWVTGLWFFCDSNIDIQCIQPDGSVKTVASIPTYGHVANYANLDFNGLECKAIRLRDPSCYVDGSHIIVEYK